MPISSRTPEGSFGHCPVCNKAVAIEPSMNTRDATCPNCGSLLWFASREREHHALIEQARQQIRQLVGKIVDLSKREISEANYWTEFLSCTVQALAAHGGFVWQLPGSQRAFAAINAQLLGNPSWGVASVAHQSLLTELSQAGPQVIPPRSELSEFARLWNPTPYLLVTATVPGSSNHWLVEILQRPETAPSVRRGYSTFLSQMGELAERHFQKA